MGGTLVTVTGYNFTESNEITCKFGTYRSGYFYKPRLSPATWLSSTKVKCISPIANKTFDWATQKTLTVNTEDTTLDISMNTQDYTTWNIPYQYSLPVTMFNVTK